MRLFFLACALPMLTACDLILSNLPKGQSEPGYPGETGISVGETGIDPGETGETGQTWVGGPLETAGVKGDTRDLTATGTLSLSGTSPDYTVTVGETAAFVLHVVELADRFAGLLSFGTAGLRGAVGAGPNRMNVAEVIRAAGQ